MKNNTNPRPVHFEIFADDPARAAKFYVDVFGWNIEKWEGPMEYWMVMTGEKGTMGIDGGIARRMEVLAQGGANSFVCTISVEDFDEYNSKIIAAGGTIEMEKHDIPGVGIHGYYRDTEGNIFAILEPGEEMKKMGEA